MKNNQQKAVQPKRNEQFDHFIETVREEKQSKWAKLYDTLKQEPGANEALKATTPKSITERYGKFYQSIFELLDDIPYYKAMDKQKLIISGELSPESMEIEEFDLLPSSYQDELIAYEQKTRKRQ